MALKAEYQIVLTKSGSGAAQAVAELEQLKTTAASTSGTTGLEALNGATKTTTASLRALTPVVALLGGTLFPKFSTHIFMGSAALSSLKNAAVATNLGLLRTTGIVAGLATVCYVAAESFRVLKAAKEEASSVQRLQESAENMASRLKKGLLAAMEAGAVAISEAEADFFDRVFQQPTIERLRLAQEQLRGRIPPGFFHLGEDKTGIDSPAARRQAAQEQIAAFEQAQRISDLGSRLDLGPQFDRKTEEFLVNRLYVDRLNLFKDLRREGLMTEQELSDASTAAYEKKLSGLLELKEQQTELQRLEEESAQMFAEGLSRAIMEFASRTKDAKEAFLDFARAFLQQIATMILQQMILNALKSVGWGSGSGTGAAFGGIFLAGSGGVFPRFMALGGVQEVSKPTYFPRFNVVAGEAGREMLTVLARPRFMQIGGVEAIVGNAGNQKLAITKPENVGAGVSGKLLVNVGLEPGLRAAIVDEAITGSIITIERRAVQAGSTREAIRRATK
jgi:hypothetical protein